VYLGTNVARQYKGVIPLRAIICAIFCAPTYDQQNFMSCDNDIFCTLMNVLPVNRVPDAITSQNILTSYFITEMTLSSWALVSRHSVRTESLMNLR
jgi:hypothetical protein